MVGRYRTMPNSANWLQCAGLALLVGLVALIAPLLHAQQEESVTVDLRDPSAFPETWKSNGRGPLVLDIDPLNCGELPAVLVQSVATHLVQLTEDRGRPVGLLGYDTSELQCYRELDGRRVLGFLFRRLYLDMGSYESSVDIWILREREPASDEFSVIFDDSRLRDFPTYSGEWLSTLSLMVRTGRVVGAFFDLAISGDHLIRSIDFQSCCSFKGFCTTMRMVEHKDDRFALTLELVNEVSLFHPAIYPQNWRIAHYQGSRWIVTAFQPFRPSRFLAPGFVSPPAHTLAAYRDLIERYRRMGWRVIDPWQTWGTRPRNVGKNRLWAKNPW